MLEDITVGRSSIGGDSSKLGQELEWYFAFILNLCTIQFYQGRVNVIDTKTLKLVTSSMTDPHRFSDFRYLASHSLEIAKR